MQHISPSSLHDLSSRIFYLSSFLDLNASDGEALLASKPLVAPLIPTILDAVYKKLLSFDITAQAFVPKNMDLVEETVGSVQELTMEHHQIALRKDFLESYLVKLVSTSDLSPSSPFWVYLNDVSIMHTDKPSFKHRAKCSDLRVEYIHIGALLGYVVDIIVGAVMEMDIDGKMKERVIRAFNKVVWIQNDLFAWNYMLVCGEGKEVEGNGVEPRGGKEVNSATGGCPFSE